MLNRSYYFKIKKFYKIFHILLCVFRLITLVFIAAFLTLVTIYTLKEYKDTLTEDFNLTYHNLINVAKYILLSLLSLWIILKIIVLILKSKLKKLKYKLEIIDEI